MADDQTLPPADHAPASAEDQTLEKLLSETQSRLQEQRDAWMRAVAETENVRKRAQADVSAAHKFAIERFAEGLVPVCDSLEATLAAARFSFPGLTLVCVSRSGDVPTPGHGGQRAAPGVY